MRVPTRFFVALITGLLLASAIYFGLLYLQLGVPSPDSYWCYEINKRKTENAAQIGQPKLLLVGGSSTLFGLSAGHIEHSVGVPTIN